jgi:hypothetical protein
MWLGIIAVCLYNLAFLLGVPLPIDFYRFGVWFIDVFGLALITVGLIITFKDKKPKSG